MEKAPGRYCRGIQEKTGVTVDASIEKVFPAYLAVHIDSTEKKPILTGKEETKMEKKVYETPEVTKVEFDASDRITASGCETVPSFTDWGSGNGCLNP